MNQPRGIYDSERACLQHPVRRERTRLFGRQLRQLLDAGLELLFPSRCAGCQRVDTVWCPECQDLLDAIPFPARQARAHSPFTALACSGDHNGLLRQALLALKYENAAQLAGPLGNRLASLVTGLQWKTDFLVPVPLHPSRERERGYNQTRLMGQVLAQKLCIPLADDALYRTGNTRAQVGLTRRQRLENVSNAFVVNAKRVQGCDLLLVDDVYTTGATLGECARALLAKGARSVFGLTLTRAVSPANHGEGNPEWM
ncbi:MAG: ComF family protein [Anaerolineaceae bacterium]|nr:ComF family protein [Anaerolineaceae bacterium]MDE0330034.1 ComF family protein [Anaerolineaceae bacterium]